MSQKLFMRFFDAVVAKMIYALRPESFCALKSANRKVLTFYASASAALSFSQRLKKYNDSRQLEWDAPQHVLSFNCTAFNQTQVQQLDNGEGGDDEKQYEKDCSSEICK